MIPAKEHKQLSLFIVFDQLIFTKDSTGMAIKPYLIEVIGIDFGTLLSSQGTGAHRFLALRPLAGHDVFPPLLRAEGET
ncbi:MAG: hypothetical protein EB044_04855 [Actinobacteria bacterium]|nr:hypothetical protein [Actinomycetota bacterium]NDE84072.1 hypothetical protein [Actinomycetota bacterium]